MGCHTWFARKVDAPLTEKEVRERAIKCVKEELDIIKRFEDGDKNLGEFFVNHYKNESPEGLKKTKKYFTRLLQKMEDGTAKQSVCVDFAHDVLPDGYRYFDGHGWFVRDVPYHDVFRRYDYPKIMLRSLKQTLRYIKNPRTKCVVYPDTIKRLEKFWAEHPDGVIYFG